MKTTFFKKALNTITITMLFVSCHKDEITRPASPVKNQFNLSVAENRLVFKSVSDYERAVSITNPKESSAFLEQVNSMEGFVSVSEKNNMETAKRRGDELDLLLDDDFMSSILNSDGTVQIGNYIILIDVSEDLVYAIDAKFSQQYSDLVARNTDNHNIMVFSAEDDVINLLNENILGTVKNINGSLAKARCKEKRAPRKQHQVNVPYGSQYRLNCRLRYASFGISHRMTVRVLNQSKFLGAWVLQEGLLWIDYNASWKQRCGDTGSKTRSCPLMDCYVVIKQLEYTLYSGIRALTNYNASAVCYNRAVPVSSPTLHIQHP